jgi:hypothetical protein
VLFSLRGWKAARLIIITWDRYKHFTSTVARLCALREALVVVAPDRFCTDRTHQLTTQCQLPQPHLQSCHPRDIESARDETRRTAAICIYTFRILPSPSHAVPPSEVIATPTLPPPPHDQQNHNHYYNHLDIAKGARAGKRRITARDYIPPHIQGLLVLISLLRSAHTSYHIAPIHAPTTTRQSMNIASSTGLLLPSLPVPIAAPPRPS